MLTKYDYIETIALELKATTDYNFQYKIGEVLKVYSKYKNWTYEMPNSSGGDDKNDGWIVEEKRFYQIYSPQQLRDSLRKDIQEKFQEDLEKLLKLIYVDNKWNGDINDFIFIVNTMDRNLPHDSTRYFDNEKERLESLYGITFNAKVVNVDYIKDLLEEMEINELQSISARLRVTSIIDYNALSAKFFYEFIDILNEGIQRKFRERIDTESTSYERISSPRKIVINNLEEVSQEIEGIILELNILEDIISTVYQDIDYADKFERIVSYTIKTYETLTNNYSGVELYHKIVENLISYTEFKRSYEYPAKILIVYIFDKCDIFEKEEVS
ncbi:hypothetical protein [Lysinibacillus parviboronicapiens]|uniref:hypothetical protein n=1 Tax=Lysinibacillus parviboronicapiens TaxID=436516 RepID=UPI000D359CB7|nr:hypothetical protein [Lysinibacillus parviboronicapiens]